MSKALATVATIVLGGIALAPVIYAVNNPAPVNQKIGHVRLDKNATNLQKISYGVGYSMGKQVPPETDLAALVAGLNDARDSKKEMAYTEEELLAALDAYIKEQSEKAAQQEKPNNLNEQTTVVTSAYEVEQEAFLNENAKRSGVKTTPSGLQYKVLREGTGKQATPDSVVTVHYEGKTTDGNIFDSSLQRQEPAKFPLKAVIPGWTEGLSLMKEGAKVELYIPAKLAYGHEAKPGIPADSVLIFQVELLKVE